MCLSGGFFERASPGFLAPRVAVEVVFHASISFAHLRLAARQRRRPRRPGCPAGAIAFAIMGACFSSICVIITA
jgi:hypothetical protein